jgi:hypothetical protein
LHRPILSCIKRKWNKPTKRQGKNLQVKKADVL